MQAILALFPANDYTLLAFIVLLPLLGAAVNGLFGKRLGKEAVSLLALSVIFISFALAVLTFFGLSHAQEGEAAARFYWKGWEWFHLTQQNGSSVALNVAFSVDALSGTMALIVTGVGFLIHLYSVSYMAEDPGFHRFLSYLNLFIFSMLVLILGDSLPVLFVGWEGVGLCSYLLIGFWFEDDKNAAAGKKAFVTNRIGDFGLLVAMGLLLYYTGALDWSGMAGGAKNLLTPLQVWPLGTHVPAASLFPHGIEVWLNEPRYVSAATLVGLALFLGAAGKSAQLPLYVWLPDAMAGPTPVSALIHAATMVTTGIYMIARLHLVFLASPFALEVVAIVGAATALFAATIALVQTDIKKMLAYSTVSQLGYMVLTLGVGAFASAIFHVMTHAFFKALLFLGAGSVIHGMSGEQDVSQMGGLRQKMPITWWTFLVGTLAIAGAPGFAGFFSKDEILAHTWGTGHYALWAVGALTAGLTAFYMFRLLFLTFFGELRAAPEVAHHVHESPPVMTAPLVILAALSIVGGWVGLPDGWLWGPAFDRFLAPVTGHPALGEHGAGVETALMVVTTLLAAAGATLAYVFYVRMPGLPYLLAWRLKPVYELLVGKYWVDELYDALVVRPYVALSTLLWRIVDQTIIDGAVNGVATAVVVNGQLWRYVQDGN